MWRTCKSVARVFDSLFPLLSTSTSQVALSSPSLPRIPMFFLFFPQIREKNITKVEFAAKKEKR